MVITFISFIFILLTTVTLIASYASSSITRPLIRLKDSVLSITNGNLETIIKPTSNDEIGELAIQFEKMRKSIKQHIEYIIKKDKELENLNKILIENENKKNQFISMISHELIDSSFSY